MLSLALAETESLVLVLSLVERLELFDLEYRSLKLSLALALLLIDVLAHYHSC